MKQIQTATFLTIAFCIFVPPPVAAQHDPGRNAVRLLSDGKLKEAGVELKKAKVPKNLKHLGQAEQDFVLAMIACKKGNTPLALSHAKAAVKWGLPFERLLAGPRDVLAHLYASEEFKIWSKTRNTPILLHGPMLGVVKSDSARIWIRTSKEAKVSVQLSEISGGKNERDTTKPVQISDKDDYTGVLKLTGLKPATRYRYDVVIDGKVTGTKGTFKTQREARAGGKYRVVFGGGAGYTEDKERMWNTIAEQEADALLLLGDNVYIDDPESSTTQRYCYYRRQARQEWRNLVASVPVYSIYDDHDFGVNDCVPGPDINKPAWKKDVWKVYTQNWNNPSYGGGEKQPGCWYDFHLGDVHFVMLDCRYYRDLKGGSMIGPVQKKWLFDTLLENKGKSIFTVVVSSVPWSHGAKHDKKKLSKDTWDGFSSEREELFTYFEQQQLDGILLVSADRHRSDIWKTPRANGYDLYEFQSSRLTNVLVHPIVKSSSKSEMLYGYNKTCSFGQLDFDTTAKEPKVTLSIVDINGKSHHSMTLTRKQLSHQP